MEKLNVNQAMKDKIIEEILNDETRKLVGYIMPVLEMVGTSQQQRDSIKKMLYTFKDKSVEMLNQAMSENETNHNK